MKNLTSRMFYGDSTRFSEEITRVFGTQLAAAEYLGVTQERVNQIVKAARYKVDRRKSLIAAGLDMDYVETGVRKKDSISVVKEPTAPYNAGQQESQPPFFRMPFRETDEVSMKQTRGNGYLEIELYMKDNAGSKRVPFSRIAEPQFDADLPIPIPIATKQGVILKQEDKFALPELEDFGHAAATPNQPLSGRAFQEGQEP